MKEALLDCLRAGPGEAARQETAIGDSGPPPCRWTLRTRRVSVDWLSAYTLSGVWRVLQTCGLRLRAACARLFSPDPPKELRSSSEVHGSVSCEAASVIGSSL